MSVDAMLEHIDAFKRAPCCGGVVVRKVACWYSLFSARTGASVVRLRPTGDGDKVQVLWWTGELWGASGPFGVATMTLMAPSKTSPTSRTSGSMLDPARPKWPRSSLVKNTKDRFFNACFEFQPLGGGRERHHRRS